MAIELPAQVKQALADLQERLRALDEAIRWTRPEHIHLTVKFLGEVPDSQIAEVCAAARQTAAGLKPVPVEVCGTGCFPPRGPVRIVWAGIKGPPPELAACHSACERSFADLGYPPEDRLFRPHLTIGRARDPRGARAVREALEQLQDTTAGCFTADELVIFQSVLGRSGPAYTALSRATFMS